MDILNLIINSMGKEDTRYFKLFSRRTNAHKDRKDLQLFDYIRKAGEDYDEDKILKKLKYTDDKNAFYRLKNRLIEDLNKSVALQNFRSDEMLYLYNLLSLVSFYFNRNNYEVAIFYLKKAEKKAREVENYELLDIIYGEFIRLSHEVVSLNPESYIRNRSENTNKLNKLRQIDDVLAVVKYRLKITQNYSSRENPVLDVLEKTIKKFSKDGDIRESAKLRFKIYQAVSQILLQKKEYVALEEYLLITYEDFSKDSLFNKGNHDTKLQMLTYIINSLFKNGKYEQSLSYAQKLYEAMFEYDRLMYDKYLIFYYNALFINYSATKKWDQAIAELQELESNKALEKTPFYKIFVYVNLTVCWFEKEDYHNAINSINKLFLSDQYENADTSIKFKYRAAELIIRFEIGDLDYLDYKIKQFKSNFTDMLNQEENMREREFIKLLKQMSDTPSIKQDEKLLININKFLEKKVDEEQRETEIIDYNEWLEGKIMKHHPKQ